MPFTIRPVNEMDIPFLWEMLYQSIHVPEGEKPPGRDILRYPSIAQYVQNWGRSGDLGFVAVDEQGERVGSITCRLFQAGSRGYGYVDDDTPEIGMAVRPENRGCGVGSLLLETLLAEASARGFAAVSLSVDSRNPALRLYERHGFREVTRSGASLVMAVELSSRQAAPLASCHRPGGEASRVFLRPLVMKDAPALLELMVRNRELFEQVVPVRHELFYTLGKQEEIIRNSEKARMEGSRYAFGIFLRETEELIGEISLFEIMRGALQRAFLGYCLDERHNGKGLMTEAVSQVLDFAFREAGLHRIEAGAKPGNPGSLRVLEKAGFQKEGLARQNVKINGKWEDHVMYAILASDPRG